MHLRRVVTAPAIALLVTFALSVLPAAVPARAAEDIGPLTEVFAEAKTQVWGSYQPIPLRLMCGTYGASILWYAPGRAPDSLWTNVLVYFDGVLRYEDHPVTINGSYEPFAGDFDGNGCTDIFWYAPGPAADYVWWYGASLSVTSTRVSVDGDYLPLVGSWDGSADRASDIFWYAPGSTRESIWTGRSTKGFIARPAPQISGAYRPSVFDGEDILWHAPGTRQDWFWGQVRFSSTRPVDQLAVTIDGSYEVHSVRGQTFLYRRTATDRAVTGFDGSDLSTNVGDVPGGPHIVGSSGESSLIVFHVPGPGIDRVWFR